MLKLTQKFILLIFVYSSFQSYSQGITVKKLPESIIPEKNKILNSALKNDDGSYSFIWMNSINTMLEEGTFTLQNLDANFNEKSEKIIVNNATPDDKRIPIPFVFKNKEMVFLASTHYYTGGSSHLHARGLKYDQKGNMIKPVIEYITTDNAVWSYVGLMPHFVFSSNKKYYACIYTSYSLAVPKEKRRVYIKLYDENNNVVYTKENFIVGELGEGIDFYARKYAIADNGEIFLAASKEVNKDIKDIIVFHFSNTGELLGKASIDNATSCFKDYNIGLSNNDLIITGITEESKIDQKANKHETQFLKKFFYAKFIGATNTINGYLESDFNIQSALINEINLTKKEHNICYDCIRIRDVIPNGKNTWVIGELNTGGELINMGSTYYMYYEIVVFNLDENGTLISVNKIKRKQYASAGYGAYYNMSTFFDDVFKTYRFLTYNNKLFVFYNAKKSTVDSNDLYSAAASDPNQLGDKLASGFVSVIDNLGNCTLDKTTNFGECICFRSFSVIEKNKAIFQLGATNKVVEVTLE